MSADVLLARIKARIASSGPMPVADYMQICLADPGHGYYMTREPFGRQGDFITAPEISQMFGEIVAMWCLYVWQTMDAPAPFILAELGPGRGTLMRDVLHAGRIRPEFGAAAQVHLVETSPRLRAAQAGTLGPDCAATWHDAIEALPEMPAIIIANEFFDALPIRQYVRRGDGWRERLIGCDAGGALAWTLADAAPDVPDLPARAKEGAIAERSPQCADAARHIARHVARHGGAALVIDYGYLGPALGDTLQAVARHGYGDPLADPGLQDLTAHVDFSALKQACEQAGARCTHAMGQGAFLKALGIGHRAHALMQAAPGEAQAIAAALERLTGDTQMGGLFRAMAILSPDLPPPPPFGGN